MKEKDDDDENDINIPLIEKNKNEIKNEIENENENPINIFFCSNEKKDVFSNIKTLLKNSSKKFVIKGEFNTDSIIDEISYYLGIETKDDEEIDENEIQNIIIFNISFKEAGKIFEIFIKKVCSKKGNDEFPFFIFYRDQNSANDFDLKQLILNINNLQKQIIDTSKIDSRNIYIDTEETIINTIQKIYNYYNGDFIINFEEDEDEKKEKYNISKTINILLMGKRGCGKSTLINRILGEKKAYSHINAKTPKEREYYHKKFPIKLIDSAGFEVAGKNEIKNIDKYLKDNNLTYQNIKKRVHFIFYLLRSDDKLDESVIKILKKLHSYNIETFFIITFSNQGGEELHKNNFKEQIKKNKIFPKEKVKGIINNTFCIDSFNLKYSKTISDIFLLVSGKLKEYKESNNIIIESIENYKNLIKTKELGYVFDNEEELSSFKLENEISSSTPFSSRSQSLNNSKNLNLDDESVKGKIFTKKNIYDPKEILIMIKDVIKNNIFMTDFESQREEKKRLARDVVQNFKWPGFWWSSFMFPILNEYWAKKSKLKMLRRISEVYDIEVPTDFERNFFNSIKESDDILTKIVKTIGTWIAGAWNFKDVSIIGEKIIEEFDSEYAKKNILDLYFDMAQKYNQSFELLENFYTCFNEDYWYDVRIKN